MNTLASRLIIAIFFLCTFASPVRSDPAPQMRGMVVTRYLNAEDIAVLKSWKVNLVRYSLVWADKDAADASNATSYATWLNEELTQFLTVLPLLEANGIKVALNLHTPPGGFSDRGSKASQRVFEEQWAQDAFITAWETIATTLNGRTGIASYEILNEPAQAKNPRAPLLDWNALAQRAAEHIRAIDANTTLVMGPVYGKITRLKTMKTLTVPNVIYTVHYYDPHPFTHQQLGKSKKVLHYPSKDGSKALALKRLKPLYTFQKKNNTSIFIGEFSVVRFAPSGEGALYLKDLLSVFERYKFSWTYHAFREADVWDLEYPNKKSETTRSPTPTDRLKAVLKVLAKNGG